MPCILKIRVVGAHDLPVMDKSSELADAYVQLKFADYDVQRTAVQRKTLNPVWNEDFRFEVSDDAELQNEPLELKVLDYDAISANDAVGSVYIDLNPLLVSEDEDEHAERQISGWFPVYDTLRGVRGQLEIQVKLQFFGDVNPFKDSSAGVQLLSVMGVPPGYQINHVYGLAEVLSSDDDPEYHWADSFRTPRSSNEARQKLLYRLSGQLRRLMGREVLEIGGNAIIGYKQSFDLEKEEGIITARAIGTCVSISAIADGNNNIAAVDVMDEEEAMRRAVLATSRSNSAVSIPSVIASAADEEFISSLEHSNIVAKSAAETATCNNTDQPSLDRRLGGYTLDAANSPTNNSHGNVADLLPAYSSMASANMQRNASIHRASKQLDAPLQMPNAEMEIGHADPKLITLHSLPRRACLSIGGIVSARSVKLLQNDEEETRDTWWMELREEIQSHAKLLQCNTVLGYTEETAIQDELIILSAYGTAMNVNFRFLHLPVRTSVTAMMDAAAAQPPATDDHQPGLVFDLEACNVNDVESSTAAPALSSPNHHQEQVCQDSVAEPAATVRTHVPASAGRKRQMHDADAGCRACHVPYSKRSAPFPMSTLKCAVCRRRQVPELLMSTIDPPEELDIVGPACLIEAYVCRGKKRKEGESNAGIVSDALPFIEYDLHRQLLYKLRIQGLNSIFGLQIHLTIGDGLIVAVASGTAAFLAALPQPPPLTVARSIEFASATGLELERRITEQSEENRRRREAMLRDNGRLHSDPSLDPMPTSLSDDLSASHDRHAAAKARRTPTAAPPARLNSVYNSISTHSLDRGVYDKHPSSASYADLSQPSSPSGARASAEKSAIQRLDVDSDSAHSSDSDSDDDQVTWQQQQSNTKAAGVGQTATQSNHISMAVQIDDDTDADMLAVLADPPALSDLVEMYTTSFPLSGNTQSDSSNGASDVQIVSAVREGTINSQQPFLNRRLATLFRDVYTDLQMQVLMSAQSARPCQICGVKVDVQLVKESSVQIQLTATVITSAPLPQELAVDGWFKHHNEQLRRGSDAPVPADPRELVQTPPQQLPVSIVRPVVRMTSLPFVPRHHVVHQLGRLSLHFVKEDLNLHAHSLSLHAHHFSATTTGASLPAGGTTGGNATASTSGGSGAVVAIANLVSILTTNISSDAAQSSTTPLKTDTDRADSNGDNDSGYCGDDDTEAARFVMRFMVEVQSVARAHVLARGGNALVGWRIERGLFRESLKNQAYGLISLSGDVVEVVADDEALGEDAMTSVNPIVADGNPNDPFAQ